MINVIESQTATNKLGSLEATGKKLNINADFVSSGNATNEQSP